MGKRANRSAKQLHRGAARIRVPEMPEEQAKSRSRRSGEDRAVIVSATGTKHRPLKRRVPRVARSRAKSPSVGRQKTGRTAKARRARPAAPSSVRKSVGHNVLREGDMKRKQPNPASAKEPAEGSREKVNVDRPQRDNRRATTNKDFQPHTDLPGKTDSGPEPEVHKNR